MKIKFAHPDKAGFFTAVRRQVDLYFKEHNKSKHANLEMVFKTFFFLVLFVGFYGLILSNAFSKPLMLLFAIALGMVQAFIGFNICHDAIHGSYSSRKWINSVFSFVFHLIGASPYVWKVCHNKVHHTFTNISGHDEDLDIAPGLIRLSPTDKQKPFMRFQQYYAFALYSLSSLSWVFRKDYIKFFSKEIGGVSNTDHPKIEYFNLFFFKFLYYALFIAVPLIFLEVAWWEFLIGFLIMHFAEGLVLGLVFQLAHVVEDTSFPEPGTDGKIEDSWAIHQMRTTANFAMNSKMAKFLCGGLNFQIEHHLFPNVCHVHYPEISRIVREVAKEYDVPYHSNSTFLSALGSHYRTLKEFGS